MKEYVGIISIASLCFAFTLAIYTYVGLLCGSGISFCCQSHLVPVLFSVLIYIPTYSFIF